MEFDEIKEIVGANEIIFAQSVGSKFYGVNNPHDEDILIVVDKKTEPWRYFVSDKDIFVVTNEEYKNSLTKTEKNDKKFRELCCLLNHEAAKTNFGNSVLYGESEERKISLFDNRQLALKRVYDFGNENFFNPRVHNKNGNKGCSKMMSWALWYYYAFQNGALELTKEQQNTIQLCHDGNLSIEYAQELKKKILQMI